MLASPYIVDLEAKRQVGVSHNSGISIACKTEITLLGTNNDSRTLKVSGKNYEKKEILSAKQCFYDFELKAALVYRKS